MLNTITNKTIYLGERINNNTFSDIIIFDNENKNTHSIMAEYGNFISLNDGIILDLYDGSIHEQTINNNEYRKTYYDNYKIAIPFDDLGYNFLGSDISAAFALCRLKKLKKNIKARITNFNKLNTSIDENKLDTA